LLRPSVSRTGDSLDRRCAESRPPGTSARRSSRQTILVLGGVRLLLSVWVRVKCLRNGSPSRILLISVKSEKQELLETVN
jgi:hypothetical protein